MTIAELIEELEKLPQEIRVVTNSPKGDLQDTTRAEKVLIKVSGTASTVVHIV